MLEDRLYYRSCIVRAWREPVGQTVHDWRLTLEVPSLGVRQGFSSFLDLVDSLRLHLAMTGDADGAGMQHNAPTATPEETNHTERLA